MRVKIPQFYTVTWLWFMILNLLSKAKLCKSDFSRSTSSNYPQCGSYRIFLSLRFLREINFGEFRCSKTAFFAILLNFKKYKNSWKPKFRASTCVKMADFELLESSKLISRKIWVTEKSCNFHTVLFTYQGFFIPQIHSISYVSFVFTNV